MPQNDSTVNPYLEPIARLAELWLDPSSPLRRKSIEALVVSTGYGEAVINRAIDNAFDQITKNKLLKFIKDEEIQARGNKNSVVLHMGAGNVFTSWLHGVIVTMLLGYPCWIKPSTKEPVFANLLHASLRMIGSPFGDRIKIVQWDGGLIKKCDAVIAYGSDESIKELRELTANEKIFIGYGNKMSIAIVLKETMEPNSYRTWIARANKDIEMFDMNGCLSPMIMFIEGADAGLWKSIELTIGQHPKIRLFSEMHEIVQNLMPYKGHLSAVGIAGDVSRVEPIRSELENLGITRICELGQMQRPPLSWRNGGVSLVEVLRSLS